MCRLPRPRSPLPSSPLLAVPFAILVWWALFRRWDSGVDTTFSRGHTSAPAYVTGLTIVGATIVLVWLWFLYIYLPALLIQLAPNVDESSWYWIGTFALFFSLPLWVVQGLAVIGLVQKHDWGAILARYPFQPRPLASSTATCSSSARCRCLPPR